MKAAALVALPTNADGGNGIEGIQPSEKEPQHHPQDFRLPFDITCYHNGTSLTQEGNLISYTSSAASSSSVDNNSVTSNLSLSSSLCDGTANSMTLDNNDGIISYQEQEQCNQDDDVDEEDRNRCTTLSLSSHSRNSSSIDDDDEFTYSKNDSIDWHSLSSDESIRDRFLCPAMVWSKIHDGSDNRKREQDDTSHPEQCESSSSFRLYAKRRRTKKRKLEIIYRDDDYRDREYIVWKRAYRNTPIIR